MDTWRAPADLFLRLSSFYQSLNIFGSNSSLCSPWSRSLMHSGICNITHGKQVGVLPVQELQCRSNADETIIWVDEGVTIRRNEIVDEAIVRLLSSG